ncbi:MAG TPA: ABC transporter ATP-binding protein [Rhodospirillales bacterium]|jgi:branched-chain amino acid transport system ATP-binding protein|nr:ABC transporter ATP-binding protein [Rhodospirillales bacterium]HIA82916.1 ABC transporter ATP-binding protein [Rhodospirillales bacterium]HIB20762.1 ABC transporter ATP-binding protein [Rhodospirillales bacterium]HIC60967.1 ABC transporter ATP-binding protein [Rhodospirillales bacterium]HIN77149.1 ABC transporter ATP-binding protein [Rhodospirillales bacterium]|tara:strand:+ start:704 stop:1402 length:699 start_codon:yes stop_codon:yes gene_type:complete
MNLLEVNNLSAFYGDFQALFNIDFTMEEGETLAVIGANGAGKSTFLKTITGLVDTEVDDLNYNGVSIDGLSAADIVGLGIAMVPEGRRLFPSLNVEENLLMGGYKRRQGHWTLDRIYELFPALVERRTVPGTALSGGEQQMTAIGRALMANPDLLLFDELSLGLAPIIIKNIYETLPTIKSEGVSILLVEQDINQALSVSDRVYCFQEGRVSLNGLPNTLSREQISAAYFGS